MAASSALAAVTEDSRKRVKDDDSQPQDSTFHLLDFCSGMRPSFGVVSPDLLGKTTACLLFKRLSELQDLAGLTCEMYFKQSHTGADGILHHDDKSYRIEVKWSCIQMQTNTNTTASSNPNYHRFEFGNISKSKFDILVLFGHHALQAGAVDWDVQTCAANVDNRLVWNPPPTDLDAWLKSCWVWLYASSADIPTTHHCSVFYKRGPYGDGGLWAHKVWGGDLANLQLRLKEQFRLLRRC